MMIKNQYRGPSAETYVEVSSRHMPPHYNRMSYHLSSVKSYVQISFSYKPWTAKSSSKYRMRRYEGIVCVVYTDANSSKTPRHSFEDTSDWSDLPGP